MAHSATAAAMNAEIQNAVMRYFSYDSILAKPDNLQSMATHATKVTSDFGIVATNHHGMARKVVAATTHSAGKVSTKSFRKRKQAH